MLEFSGAKGAPGPPTCAHNATSCSSRRAKGDCSRVPSRPAPSPSSTLPPSQWPTRVSPSCQPVDCLVRVHLVYLVCLVYLAYLGTDVSTLETPPSTRIRRIQAPAIKRQGSVWTQRRTGNGQQRTNWTKLEGWEQSAWRANLVGRVAVLSSEVQIRTSSAQSASHTPPGFPKPPGYSSLSPPRLTNPESRQSGLRTPKTKDLWEASWLSKPN